MPQDYIDISTTKVPGVALVKQVARLRAVADELEHLRDVMLHNTDSGDWSDMEAVFGVPAGSGEAVYNMVNSAISQLGHADVQALFDRVGTNN